VINYLKINTCNFLQNESKLAACFAIFKPDEKKAANHQGDDETQDAEAALPRGFSFGFQIELTARK